MMDTALTTYVREQITQIAHCHFEELGERRISKSTENWCEQIIQHAQQLAHYCCGSSQDISYAAYQDVFTARQQVRDFLKVMNQDLDGEFAESYLGYLLTQTSKWLEAAGRLYALSTEDVWNLLTPVRPDALYSLGHCVYEAKWWPPVPVMEVEILRRTEGVTIESEYFETRPTGIFCVRFSVTPF